MNRYVCSECDAQFLSKNIYSSSNAVCDDCTERKDEYNNHMNDCGWCQEHPDNKCREGKRLESGKDWS